MVEKRLYNIIAAFGALFIYLFFIYLLVDFIKNSEELIQDFGYNVEDAIVVDIAAEEKEKPIEKKIEEPKPKPIPVLQPVVTPPKPEVKPEVIKEAEVVPEPEKKEESKQEEKESRDKEAKSAKDLFSTVRTDKFDKAMQERRKEEAARASRLKKQKAEQKRKQEKERRERQEALTQARAAMQELETPSAASHKKAGMEDAFWSPVANRIEALWNRTIQTQHGLSADVRITINSQGRLTYRIKRLSSNTLFNKKLKLFLQNLEYETFPKYRGGGSTSRVILFEDQEGM